MTAARSWDDFKRMQNAALPKKALQALQVKNIARMRYHTSSDGDFMMVHQGKRIVEKKT
jgi:hypothetical protein